MLGLFVNVFLWFTGILTLDMCINHVLKSEGYIRGFDLSVCFSFFRLAGLLGLQTLLLSFQGTHPSGLQTGVLERL